ncbi:Hypothetical predicted protein [Marmota monax]|uniref:Uncharacterized protein n=1 Tax=Marmota monax TaxID=9995 RepID=A0A5E4BY22_MARMO|nr:hypothetical protein GHT09_001643 [Marmota monax]VTJ74538.1 Hypothetical predicted protein [Marmota monax]
MEPSPAPTAPHQLLSGPAGAKRAPRHQVGHRWRQDREIRLREVFGADPGDPTKKTGGCDQRAPVFISIRSAIPSREAATLGPHRPLGQKPGHWASGPGDYPRTCGTTDTRSCWAKSDTKYRDRGPEGRAKSERPAGRPGGPRAGHASARSALSQESRLAGPGRWRAATLRACLAVVGAGPGCLGHTLSGARPGTMTVQFVGDGRLPWQRENREVREEKKEGPGPR